MSDLVTTTWRDEIEELIRALIPKSLGGIMIRGKGAVFVDVIADVAYQTAQQFNKQHNGSLEEQFARVFIHLIEDTTLHELTHKYAERPSNMTKSDSERYIRRAVYEIQG